MHPNTHLTQILARQRTADLMARAPRRRARSRRLDPPVATLPRDLVRGETLVVLNVTSEVVVLGRITDPSPI